MAALGVSMRIEWRGNMRFVRDIIKRADPVVIQREVLFPWRRWVLEERIPMMYQAKGAVPSEQPRWAKLSEWTYGQKGPAKSLVMLSAKQYSGSAMVKRYNVKWRSSGSNSFDIMLWNTARSSSKWSPGFDYPSALHTGWGPYTVRPRPGGPGYLRIPFLGSFGMGEQGLTFKAGKAGKQLVGTRKTKKGRTVAKYRKGVYSQFDMYRAITKPSGAPARPHIKFFRMDALELAQRVVDWCMAGQRSGGTRRAA